MADIPYGADHPEQPWLDRDGQPIDPPKVVLTRLADVKPERVEWLWPGRLPAGKLVTLDGDPGLGKSTLALNLGATITRGGMWPDGTPCRHPGAVLLLSAEDGLADTVRPRLDAAGADVTLVHAIDGVPVIDAEGDRALRPPTLADIVALEAAVVETAARLLVVDVVMAYLPAGTDSHRDQDVRAVLSRLSGLADRTGCTVLLLRHLNKAKGGDPLYRGGGSIGIVGAARAGLLVAADPDDPARRVLASVKNNLGPAPESLAYRLADVPELGVARVVWEGSSAHTARDLLADRGDESKTEAEQWLSDFMAEQTAAPSKAVKAAAAKAGISERTLQRAVKSLGLTVASRGYPRVTWWEAPGAASHDTTPPGPSNRGATGATVLYLHKQGDENPAETQSRQLGSDGATGPPQAGKTVCGCGQPLETPASTEAGQCAECRLGSPSNPRHDNPPTERPSR